MKNRGIRVLAVLLLVAFLLNLESFLDHARFFLSGEVTDSLVTGNWFLVALNVAVFTSFLFFLRYRRSIDWTSRTSYGIYTAFIVSLFVEMYGIPLTIFLGQGLVSGPVTPPDYILSFRFLGSTLAMNAWMLAGVAVTVLGMALVASGWWKVYGSRGLVTSGLYRYSRNPQYLGIILIALGWVIGWPTVLTLALFPFVLYAYYRLAKNEGEEMLERYGDEYSSYMRETPVLL